MALEGWGLPGPRRVSLEGWGLPGPRRVAAWVALEGWGLPGPRRVAAWVAGFTSVAPLLRPLLSTVAFTSVASTSPPTVPEPMVCRSTRSQIEEFLATI